MPAARKGDFLIHVLIALWLGASHWSKPRPLKLPGVTGLAAYAGALSSVPERTSASAAARGRASQERVRKVLSGMWIGEASYISWNVGKLRNPNPFRHISNSGLSELQMCNSNAEVNAFFGHLPDARSGRGSPSAAGVPYAAEAVRAQVGLTRVRIPHRHPPPESDLPARPHVDTVTAAAATPSASSRGRRWG